MSGHEVAGTVHEAEAYVAGGWMPPHPNNPYLSPQQRAELDRGYKRLINAIRYGLNPKLHNGRKPTARRRR